MRTHFFITLFFLSISSILISQTNVALNKPVNSSGYNQASHPPENVVDGNLSTTWRTLAWDYHYIVIDLETNYNISNINIHWGDHYAYHYVIYFSSDSINWGHYVYEVGGTGGLEEFDIPVSGRYFQLYCLNSATGQGFSINEIEIFGEYAQYNDFTTSNLPLVFIDTDESIPDDTRITASFKTIDNENGINNINDPATYEGPITIEIRGRSSNLLSPKKSYNFTTIDSHGEELDVSLLGMPEECRWILNANHFDKTMLRNPISYHLWEKKGYYSSRFRHCEVFLNGEYMGVYVFQERIQRDRNRLALKTLRSDDNEGLALTGGYIIRIDYNFDEFNSWESPFPPPHNDNGQTIKFRYRYPNSDRITDNQKNYIQNYVTSVEQALYDNDFNTFRNLANEISFIDYFIIEELSKNVDGYRSSTFLYKDRDDVNGRLRMGPVWDYDIAYSNAFYCNATNPAGWMYMFCDPNDDQQVPFWWEKLMTDQDYKNKLRCRWESLRADFLNTQYINDWIDSVALVLDESKNRNFERWPVLNQQLWNNPVVFETYEEEINYLKNWFSQRLQWMDNNIPGTCEENENLNLLFINEFMASNSNTIADINDNYEDWIEIYNASSQTIDIAGLFISDNPENLTKHQIPYGYDETKIAPGEFLLLWADGEGTASPLHLSFKLSASEGESVIIYQQETDLVIDSITFGPQATDISYGRYQDGEDNWLFFTQPTPGASNIYNEPPDIISGLYINEFMASNGETIATEFGEYEDWIEIYNSSNQDIDLAGYFITDNLSNFYKYQIPEGFSEVTTIPAGGFLLIWADGEPQLGPLHTSFKLSKSGEAVGLMHPDGVTILDSITFGQQIRDISYGRIMDGHSDWKFFNTPTPGASNHASNVDDLFSSEDISIYPNPASDYIIIKLPITDNYNIKIIDILGQTIDVFTMNSDKITIPINNYKSGMYYVNISNATVDVTKKFVK